MIGQDRIWELARAFMPSRILLTAVELGVFGALGDGPLASEDVASKLGADARATDRLMNALVVLGFLVKDGDRFRNAPDVQESLVPGEPGYSGDALGHIVNLWDSWSALTDCVRAGTSTPRWTEKRTQDWAKPFIAAMEWNAKDRAPELIGLLDLSDVRRVLDVGGGSGIYSIEMCRAKPDIEAVVFDLQDVVPITQDYIDRARMAGRVTTVAGDYNTDELGRDFDLVLLSQIIHSNSPAENRELFAKCGRALRPGGQIVVQEFVVDEGRISPPNAVLFALNMLVNTSAGDTYTQSEVTEWLKGVGFGDVRRIDPPSGGSALLVATKSR